LIKAVIFDWFNTLARYEPPREKIHSRALQEFGIEVEPAKLIKPLLSADKYFFDENTILPVRKRSAEEQEKLYSRYEEILMSEAGLKFSKGLPLKVYRKSKKLFGDTLDFVLFDDVLPVMKTLKEKKLTIGLLTNYAKDMAPLIKKLALDPYIDFVVTPYDAGADKPDPQIFRFALKKAGVIADKTIYIGDQYKVDIMGARGVGITALLIDRYNIYTDTTDCPRINSLFELNKYLS
jgi:putative hydrolase of the HAD superfamily